MALAARDLTTVTNHLGTPGNLLYIVNQLAAGRGKPVTTKYENFKEIKWWLKSMLMISADDEGVREVADLIQSTSQPAIIIETMIPPYVDVAKEKKKITDDCAYAATIRSIYVQLDTAQNKHQPISVPIGTRSVSKGEMFGTYATTAWHLANTMQYMATWATALTGMEEGKKVEHGQKKRVPIGTVGMCSFEAYCMLLDGTKYVTFHCYPNSK